MGIFAENALKRFHFSCAGSPQTSPSELAALQTPVDDFRRGCFAEKEEKGGKWRGGVRREEGSDPDCAVILLPASQVGLLPTVLVTDWSTLPWEFMTHGHQLLSLSSVTHSALMYLWPRVCKWGTLTNDQWDCCNFIAVHEIIGVNYRRAIRGCVLNVLPAVIANKSSNRYHSVFRLFFGNFVITGHFALSIDKRNVLWPRPSVCLSVCLLPQFYTERTRM